MLVMALDVLVIALASPNPDEEWSYRIENALEPGSQPKSREHSVKGAALNYCR
jgi:hypothetical protein